MSRWRGKGLVQPEGKVRRSQAITTYGPGALVDLVDQAVLVGGLNQWEMAEGAEMIQEPRLRESVLEQMQAGNPDARLNVDQPFRLPPAGNDQEPSKKNGVRVFEFPEWFVCQNAGCRTLTKSSQLTLKRGRYFHDCLSRGEHLCVPMRFVYACRLGHLQDINWPAFAHTGASACSSMSLQFNDGGTGDFGAVNVSCKCGAGRRLSEAYVVETNPACAGRQPWLGYDAREDCTEKVRLLVRTASNAYFSQVVSALSIEDEDTVLFDAVTNLSHILASASREDLPVLRKVPQAKVALDGFSDDDVYDALEMIRAGKKPKRPELRTAEFRQFACASLGKVGDLPPPKDTPFYALRMEPPGGLPSGMDSMVLAHRLREVRVQMGFTRLEAPSPNLQGAYDLDVARAPLGLNTDWLPAIEIRGEGIYLRLDEDAVQAWEKSDPVLARSRELRIGFDAWCDERLEGKTEKERPTFVGARFYLLHSLSHLLMNALSLECGYSASALSERIYCAPANDDDPMAAILISTGSPGAEGTLGGLVEQGTFIRQHLRRAYDLGTLCSHDPVCASHAPLDQSERYLEGAACHGCLFIAESSCERFNRYLDRALVVPTMGHDGVAFFTERP